MKILMLTPYVPYPPSSGGQIRTYNLLKHLSKKNQITLVALYKDENEKKYFQLLKKYCKAIYLCQRPKKPWQIKTILTTVFSRLPFLVVRNYSQEASLTVKQILDKESFDVIHAETFYIMPHIPKTKIPILLVEQTIEYEVYNHFLNSLPLFIRLVLKIDILKLKYWERYFWRKANIVTAVCPSDESIIRNLEPDIKTTIVPNGAGDEMFITKFTRKNLENPAILFQGNYFWLQNVEAADFLINRVYPKLVDELPSAEIIISGQNAKKIVYQQKKNLRVIDIPADDFEKVKKLYNGAALFIAPIFGPGGTRLKILAAMAAGVPVIATKVGLEGLGITNKKEAIIADGADNFVNEIKAILSDMKLYEKTRKNAYNFVKDNYSWDQIAKKLEAVYKSITKI